MTALVIAEHDNAVDQGRHAQHRHRRAASAAARCTCWSPAHNAGARRAGRRADRRRRPRCCTPTRAACAARPGRERRRAGAGARRRLQPHPVPGHRARQEHRAARGRQARRGADHRHHQGRSAPTPSSARSTPATRSPPCRASMPIKVITVRTTGFDAAAASGGSGRGRDASRRWPTAACRSFVGSEIAKNDRPELTAAKIIVSRRPRAGQQREVQRGADAAGRQARRRARRQPRRGRCRLCAQRLAGRPDRQDRRAAAVHRLRHQRRDPAPGRHEGPQGHRRDQQGRRRRRSSASPTTASRPTCSPPCPSW